MAVIALSLCMTTRTLNAQQVLASNADPVALPNAPTPNIHVDPVYVDDSYSSDQTPQQPQTAQQPQTQPQTVPPQDETPEQRKARAEAQLKAEEGQRMFGVLPAFNTVYGGNALPLTSGEKFHLFLKGITDPFQFAIVAVDTGIQEIDDTYPQYHHGVPGLLRNYGAAYADDFDGNLFGNAILPSLLHQDPRYYRLGTGSFKRRLIYSAESTIRCKGDNGKWEPNYSNVFGNLIGGAISNAYYPASDRGVGLTLDRGLTVTAEGAIGSLLIEFYPDVINHFKHSREQAQARKAAAAASATSTQP